MEHRNSKTKQANMHRAKKNHKNQAEYTLTFKMKETTECPNYPVPTYSVIKEKNSILTFKNCQNYKEGINSEMFCLCTHKFEIVISLADLYHVSRVHPPLGQQ